MSKKIALYDTIFNNGGKLSKIMSMFKNYGEYELSKKYQFIIGSIGQNYFKLLSNEDYLQLDILSGKQFSDKINKNYKLKQNFYKLFSTCKFEEYIIEGLDSNADPEMDEYERDEIKRQWYDFKNNIRLIDLYINILSKYDNHEIGIISNTYNDNLILFYNGLKVEYNVVYIIFTCFHPKYRGYGLCPNIVKKLIKNIGSNYDGIYAYVSEDRYNALNCFTKAGFTITQNIAGTPKGSYCITYGALDKIKSAAYEVNQKTRGIDSDMDYDPYSIYNPFLF